MQVFSRSETSQVDFTDAGNCILPSAEGCATVRWPCEATHPKARSMPIRFMGKNGFRLAPTTNWRNEGLAAPETLPGNATKGNLD
jgi:hypothetical protein